MLKTVYPEASALDFYFSPRELLLINKNQMQFCAYLSEYENFNYATLLREFINLGNIRFKLKTQKLRYLAMYEILLNHQALLPSEEYMQEVFNKIATAKMISVGDDIDIDIESAINSIGKDESYVAIEDNNNEKNEEDVLKENDNNQQGEIEENNEPIGNTENMDSITCKNSDIIFKVYKLQERIEELKEFLQSQIGEIIDYADNFIAIQNTPITKKDDKYKEMEMYR